MGAIAYSLREEFAGEHPPADDDGEPVPVYTGGLIRLDADRELNVREALDENDGVIVIEDSDQPAIVALDGYHALKRVAVPEGAEPIEGAYADRTNNELRAELNRRGVGGGGNKTHDELVAALDGYDTLNADGALPDELTVKAIEEARAGSPEGGE